MRKRPLTAEVLAFIIWLAAIAIGLSLAIDAAWRLVK